MRSTRVWTLLLLLCAGLPARAAGQPDGAAPAPAPAPLFRVGVPDHPTLEIAGDVVRIELRGRFDADLIRTGGTADPDGLTWSGRRLGIVMRVGRHLEGEVSRELDGREPWRDASLTWRAGAWLSVRGGRFKVPFSEERLRGLGSQDFLERSLASRALAPGRDIGLLGGGRLAHRLLEWEAGVFEGRGEAWDRRTPLESTPASRLVALRVGVRPFAARPRSLWRSARAAVAMTGGDRAAGLTAIGGRTIPDREAFTLPVFVQGRERRLGLEAQWAPGPLHLRAEWMQLSQERRAQGFDGEDLSPLRARGWFASAVWRVYRRPGDDRDVAVDWLRSVDLAVRLEGLSYHTGLPAASDTHPIESLPLPRHRALTAGATWAVHRWVALQVNVVREQLDDPGIAVLAGGSRTSLTARLRLDF